MSRCVAATDPSLSRLLAGDRGGLVCSTVCRAGIVGADPPLLLG
jgi:hypothetical protein